MSLFTHLFRFASPSCWCAAILFFFLPWIDISCSNDRKAGRQETMSGAQIAWGGTFWDTSRTPRCVLGCLLLNAYFVGIVVFATLTPFFTPCCNRGELGFWIALLLLGCLLGACGLLNKFFNPFSEHYGTLLIWYYASYFANAVAVVFFLVELCFLEDFSPRKARHAPL